MVFSGGDGAATNMEVRIIAVGADIIYQRAFMSFDTSTLSGITSATLGFTVFNQSGSNNYIIRIGNDLIGTNPDNPSYELNWAAHNGETILHNGSITNGLNEYDITNQINTSGDTDIRISISGDVEGPTVLSVYTTENGTGIPYIYWETAGGQITPTTQNTPNTHNTPNTQSTPTITMRFGDSGYIYAQDDWGIRFIQTPLEDPPPTEE